MKSYKGISDYSEFTEVSGKPITQDQLYRMRHRYSWAKKLVNKSKIGLELCCGAGQGLNIVSENLDKVYAVDITKSLIDQASLAAMKVEGESNQSNNNNKKGFIINCKLKI